MTKLTIHSVCPKKQVYPMILNFQNGCPSENFQFECALLQDELGSKTVAVEFNRLLYTGIEDNDLGQTFILARNRVTGKVRLIQAGTATLKPLNDYSIQNLEKVVEPDKLGDEFFFKSNRGYHSQLLTKVTNEVDHRPNRALPEPNQSQHPEKKYLKTNQSEENKILPNRPNFSLSVTSDSELNSLIVCEQSLHMPDILKKDIEMEGIQETEETNTNDIISELSSKYNHIINYYYEELYEQLDDKHLKRKTGEREKLGKANDDGFSMIKEMFVKAIGLNIKVGEKRRQQLVHTTKENNKMTVDSHPSIIQKIGNFHEENDNEAQHFGDDFNTAPLERKTYICGCCNSTFEDKDSIAKKGNHSKSSENTKVVKDNVIKFYDEDNATANHEATKVSGNNLVISDDKQDIQIFHNEIKVTDNFKDSNDDCPINLAEDFDLKQNQLDSERNFICYHCEKTFEEKGSLIFHLLAHNVTIDRKSREVTDHTTQERKTNEIVKANDLKPKITNEQNEKNTRTELNKSKIATQARVITRRMHLAAQKLINDRNIRVSKIITTDNETIQEHKEIENLHDRKVKEDGKTMRPDHDQHPERSNLKTKPTEENKMLPNRTNYSLSVKSDSELNSLIVSEQSLHMPDILKKDIQMEGVRETDEANTNDITTELSRKYNHIVKYYHDELYEPFDYKNLERNTGEHGKLRNDNGESFSIIKEMFVKALGLNIKVGEKRQQLVHTINNSKNNKMTVDSHPAIIQKMGNFHEDNDNEAQHFSDDTAPHESKTYICGCCNSTFEDKGSIILHLKSQNFMRNAKKAGRLVKRLAEKINSNDRHGKQYGPITKNAKKRNHSKSSENTKVVKDNVIRFNDEDNTIANHEATKVSGNNLVISDDKQDIQIFHNEIKVPDNFKDSNDDCPIHLAEDFDLKQNKLDPERHFICYHCEKTFEEKGSLIFHLLAHKVTIDRKSREVINHTKQERKTNEIVKANDLKPKITNEQNEKNTRTDINKSKIATHARVITRRMHLAAQKLINDRNIRESKIITTDNETIEEHKEIENLHDLKVNEDGKNMRPDREDRSSNDRDNAKRTNGVMARARTQMKKYGNIYNSNENSTNNNAFECNDCGRKFKREALLITHNKSHSNSTTKAKRKEITLKPHITSMNDSNSSNLKEKGIKLTSNLEKHTKKTKFCTLCEYKTPYASRLARHTRVHTKSNKCEHCEKEFRKKHDLIIHLRTHSGDKPFRCQCGSSFARVDTLNRHLKAHTGEKPYNCTLCPSKFKLQSGLKRHLKIHAEKTYKCTTCASSFSDGSSLKRHMRCHIISKKPYSCESCKYSSAQSYDLKRHTKICKGRLRASCPNLRTDQPSTTTTCHPLEI